MLESLGKRAAVAPLLAVLLISIVFGTAFAPVMHAGMRDVPIAVASLDAGAQTPAGEVNAGREMAAKLTQMASISGAFDVRKLASQSEVDAALEGNDVYAALVIPEKFTAAQVAKQMAATQGQGRPSEDAAAAVQTPAAENEGKAGDSSVVLYVNVGKNPMLASQIAQALPEQLAQAGVDVRVEQVHTADLGGGLMAPLFAVQGTAMPWFVMTMVGSILIFLVFRPRKRNSLAADELDAGANHNAAATNEAASGSESVSKSVATTADETRGEVLSSSWRRTVVLQLAMIVVVSGLAALLAYGIAEWMGGLTLPFGTVVLALWIASACTMALFVGLLDLALPVGVLVIVLTFALGTVTAMLAPEMMPSFWGEWVTPWAPQFQVGQALREILYMDSGVWTSRMPVLIGEGAVGLVLLGLSALRRK